MCAGHEPFPPKSPSRRGFLFKLGIALNAAIYLPMVAWSLREPYTGHGDVAPEVRRRRKVVWGVTANLQAIALARDLQLL